MKFLQYIQGDCVHNWIDSGLNASSALDVEITFAMEQNMAPSFGASRGTGTNTEKGYYLFYWYGMNGTLQTTITNYRSAIKSNSGPQGLIDIDHPHTLTISPKAKTLAWDGTVVTTTISSKTPDLQVHFPIGQSFHYDENTSGGVPSNTEEDVCPIRIHGARFWTNDGTTATLVRDFVPVLENGVATLYDKVTDTVFVPGGTVPFTAGPQVPDLDFAGVKSMMVPVPAETNLPYDSEVEYLESTGTQWIDTGVAAPLTGTFSIIFESMETLPIPTGEYKMYAGDPGESLSNRFLIYANQEATTYQTYYNRGSESGFSTTGKIQAQTDLAVSLGYSGKPSIALFGQRTAQGGISRPAKMRLYSFAIKDSTGAFVRDFHPVRKNGVGYLFDKVSGQLFGNQGTGAFLYGQDTHRLSYDAEVEYLQTDGNCWIDTGVIPLLTDTIEMRQYVTDSGNGAFGTVGAAWRRNAYALCRWQFWLGGSSTSSVINPRGDAIWKIENKSLYKDGTLLQAFPDATGDPIRSIYLFAIHDNNTSPTYKLVSGCRVYSFRLIRNGEILADYIPVRKNGVGYMYDKITGGMFGNIGTGTLTYGQDKSLTLYPVEKVALPKFPPVDNAVEVEYVQTDGGKCFDTGIAIGTDIGIEMTFWMPEHTSGNYILGNIPNWSTDRFQFGWFDYSTRQTLRFDSYPTENREFTLGYNKWRRLTYGNGIVQLDNEVKAYTPSSIVTTANLYVMGRGNTSNDGYAGLRIKGCRVFKAGVLVRDLTPLKVGTEGCLYDKVSGTVLHATGTGSGISCGPEKTTAIWEHQIGYVKSGLIGWWDGILNTRDGHSGTTTIWEDLGPNQWDAVARTSSSWRWLDKCYNGLSNTGEGFAIPRDFTNALATALTNGGLTIEMVFACDEDRRMSIFSQYGSGTGFEFYPQSYAGVYRSYFSGSPDVWANVWPTSGYATIHTGATVVGGTVANVVAYGDGEQLTTNATLPAVSTINSTYSFILGGENNRSTMSINGRLYCVRVYNRALTPVEVAQNAAVDRGRFGI